MKSTVVESSVRIVTIRRRCSLIRWAGTLLLLGASALPAHAADRMALVIGNGAYQQGNELINPPNDAADIAEVLGHAGFQVTSGRNLTREQMDAALNRFRREAAAAKAVLFFFAGHGLEVGGSNYLVPVDAQIEEEYQVRNRTIVLDEVLGAMGGDGERLKIVILDCCRNNPLGRGWKRGGGAGLAVQATPEGTVMMFATSPKATAEDGHGRNSPFSAVLKEQIAQPGLELYQVFQRVGNGVGVATQGKQRPWINSSFYGSFAFVSGTPALVAKPAAPAPVALPPKPAVVSSAASTSPPQVASFSVPRLPMPAPTAPVSSPQPQLSVRQWEEIKKDENGLAWVKRGNKWGLIDSSGRLIVEPQWDDYYFFSEGLAKVELNRKFGYINPAGQVVIRPQWDSADSFSDGLAHAARGSWRGFISKTGATVFECQWEVSESFSEGMAVVIRKGGMRGYINTKGALVIPCKFTIAHSFQNGRAKVWDGDESAVIDKTGRIVVPFHKEP